MNQIQQSVFDVNVQAPGNAVPEELLNRWSWGGFLLPIVWPFWNANDTWKLITAVCFVLGLFSMGLPTLILSIYYGIKGNRIAARDRSFASVEQYMAVQSAWAKWGVIVIVACCIPLLLLLLAMWHIITAVSTNHP